MSFESNGPARDGARHNERTQQSKTASAYAKISILCSKLDSIQRRPRAVRAGGVRTQAPQPLALRPLLAEHAFKYVLKTYDIPGKAHRACEGRSQQKLSLRTRARTSSRPQAPFPLPFPILIEPYCRNKKLCDDCAEYSLQFALLEDALARGWCGGTAADRGATDHRSQTRVGTIVPQMLLRVRSRCPDGRLLMRQDS